METRAQREAALIASRLGFRDVRGLIESKRREERRTSAAVYIGEERRTAERRAMADSARVSAWLARFEESRRALV